MPRLYNGPTRIGYSRLGAALRKPPGRRFARPKMLIISTEFNHFISKVIFALISSAN
jgi:hypothetical protein